MKKLCCVDNKKRTGLAYFYWLAIVSILGMSCSNKKNNVNNKKWNFNGLDTLVYSDKLIYENADLVIYKPSPPLLSVEEMHVDLKLAKDSVFKYMKYSSYRCSGNIHERLEVLGIYQIEGDFLTLKPEIIEVVTVSKKLESKTTYSIYEANPYKIKTKYKNITWNGVSNLLSAEFDSEDSCYKENDYMRFASQYNGKFIGYVHNDRYLKRLLEPSLDISQIPLEWRGLFEIRTKVINKTMYRKDEFKKHLIIELDKGKKNGLTKGMVLYSKSPYQKLQIDSITSNRSYGKVVIYNYIDFLPIGTIFITQTKK